MGSGPLVSLVFPLYCSIKAIETKSLADDQQWLTYWVLYSLITLFELTFSKVLEWYHVYQHFIRPFYRNPQVKLWYIPGQKGIFGNPDDDDILTAAENYVQQNGPEAFERISLLGLTEKQEAGAAATQSFIMIMNIN
ncbi:hypothetical protein CASFOL_011642 [Castilleja foliolosa]|uniref:HVA22-like protein n=1 Tax=Castilleja foliolosa TaxID=1961234 RepID=A0ABD3DXY4_9LAMI